MVLRMSGFNSEPARSHEHHPAIVESSHGNPKRLQRQTCDKMAGNPPEKPAVTSYKEDEEAAETDISAGQKMLSAVSGSLLTSILGMAPSISKELFSMQS